MQREGREEVGKTILRYHPATTVRESGEKKSLQLGAKIPVHIDQYKLGVETYSIVHTAGNHR